MYAFRSHSSSSSSSGHHRRSKKSSRHSSSRYKKLRNYSSRSRRRSQSHSNSHSRNSRSLSKDRRRRRSRSRSRDRYRSRRHHRSRSRSKGRGSRYHSRSSSNDTRSRHSRSPYHSNSSSSSGSKKVLPTAALPPNTSSDDQLKGKLLKAIKAAESADHQLKQQGVLAKDVKSRNDLSMLAPAKPQSDIIKEIDKDEFIQKTYTSTKSKKASSEEVPLTSVEELNNVPEDAANSIFHASVSIIIFTYVLPCCNCQD